MGSLFWNIVLAFAWAALFGELTALQLLVGFVLGFVALKMTNGSARDDQYHKRIFNLLSLLRYVGVELVRSNFKLAFDVVTPHARSAPAIVAYRLDARTDAEITLLVMVMSYIPGSQAMEVSEDRKTLFIHGMFVEDRDQFCAQLKHKLEMPLLEVLR